MTYLAEPGENNVFSTRHTSTPTEMLLLDAGATIRGCTPVEGGVRCSNLSGAVYAHLRDGDDQRIGAFEFWGGPGNDRLSYAYRASGGPGDDTISEVRFIYDDDGDKRGRDHYVGAAPIPNDVSLSPSAELSYNSRTAPVHLDLRPGHPSEDRVSAVPKIDGTPGADVLIGDDGPNAFSGGGGHDVVRGMGGNDVLDGDTVDGGDGDDTLDGGFLGGRVRCGPGRDVVIAEPRARVGSDCEVIGMTAMAGPGSASGFSSGCRARARRPCPGSIRAAASAGRSQAPCPCASTCATSISTTRSRTSGSASSCGLRRAAGCVPGHPDRMMIAGGAAREASGTRNP